MSRDIKTLLASVARTTSDVSSSIALPKRTGVPTSASLKSLVFLLGVTNADTDANDTLDVFIQESPDGGTTWNDICHFAQVIGTASAGKQQAIINCEAEPEIEMAAPSDAAMAVSTVRQGPVCSPIRAKYIIVDGGSDADQTFTFSLICQVNT